VVYNTVICLLYAMNGKKASKKGTNKLDEPQEFIQKISERIRELRQAAGYTSHETFAYEHGIDRTQWSKMERGVNMTLLSLHRAMQALKVTPQEFFKGFD
jgi:hypothetical protein